MEVLNLATMEKQDEILSNFPITSGAVKVIQRGIASVGTGGKITVTINAVDVSRSFLDVQHGEGGTVASWGSITSPTTIELTSSRSTGNINWQLIEFN